MGEYNFEYVQSNNIEVFPSGYRGADYIKSKLTTEENLISRFGNFSTNKENNKFYVQIDDYKYIGINGYIFKITGNIPSKKYAVICLREITGKNVGKVLSRVDTTSDTTLDVSNEFRGLGFTDDTVSSTETQYIVLDIQTKQPLKVDANEIRTCTAQDNTTIYANSISNKFNTNTINTTDLNSTNINSANLKVDNINLLTASNNDISIKDNIKSIKKFSAGDGNLVVYEPTSTEVKDNTFLVSPKDKIKLGKQTITSNGTENSQFYIPPENNNTTDEKVLTQKNTTEWAWNPLTNTINSTSNTNSFVRTDADGQVKGGLSTTYATGQGETSKTPYITDSNLKIYDKSQNRSGNTIYVNRGTETKSAFIDIEGVEITSAKYDTTTKKRTPNRIVVRDSLKDKVTDSITIKGSYEEGSNINSASIELTKFKIQSSKCATESINVIKPESILLNHFDNDFKLDGSLLLSCNSATPYIYLNGEIHIADKYNGYKNKTFIHKNGFSVISHGVIGLQYKDESTSAENRSCILYVGTQSSGKAPITLNGNGEATVDTLTVTGNDITAISAEINAKKLICSETIHGSAIYATSDKRLKENIQEYTCEKSILDLPIKKFDFINGNKNNIGCIAQDLQEICPEIVHEDEKGYLSIEESKLVYLLLQEVKELKKEVEELKKRGK